VWLLVAVFSIGLCGTVVAQEAAPDRYIGYYYPAPSSEEDYGPRVQTVPSASSRTRVAFITGLAQETLHNQYAPPFLIFTKGAENRHVIITGLDDEGFSTLFRMRAWLAGLTAMARSTSIFSEIGARTEDMTFLDLLKLLGFKDLIITDGKTLTHRITLL